MISIPQLEIHISHSCNYSCISCSHFSQIHMQGHLSLVQAESWYKVWSKRINPSRFSLLGGEPTLNPNLAEHIRLAHSYWPASQLRLTTNGTMLHKHSFLPVSLADHPNHIIQLSRHFEHGDFEVQFGNIVELLESWKSKHGINYTISDSFNKWTQRYLEKDGKIHPFTDNNQRQSWEVCKCRTCISLHEGKIWKCPIMAYLPMALKKTGQLEDEQWQPYLKYKPLEPDYSDAELVEFLAREDEAVCKMCPSKNIPIVKPDPT